MRNPPASEATLRDEFAVRAMTAMLRTSWKPAAFGDDPATQPVDVADDAYRIADAMLERRTLSPWNAPANNQPPTANADEGGPR